MNETHPWAGYLVPTLAAMPAPQVRVLKQLPPTVHTVPFARKGTVPLMVAWGSALRRASAPARRTPQYLTFAWQSQGTASGRPGRPHAPQVSR